MAKYKNKKVEVDGILFASKRESNRYLYLKQRLQAGSIKDLELQKEYEIVPAQYETYKRYGRGGKQLKDGRRCIERSVKYKADFVYFDKATDKEVVEDAKGKRTKDYVIKRKLMLYVHNIKIKEV